MDAHWIMGPKPQGKANHAESIEHTGALAIYYWPEGRCDHASTDR